MLTTDKGVVLIVMDRKEYIEKATNRLSQCMYRSIDKDPTNRLKAKIIILLRQLKRDAWLEEHIYKYMQSTGYRFPTFCGLSTIHKPNTPLRPIVSSRDSVTYGVAKVLTKILKPLVGRSPYHIHSVKDFMERESKIIFKTGECPNSYDVIAVFTSAPADPALNIIQRLLEQVTLPYNRTVLLVENIIQLLGFCLHNTYFSFQGQFYNQVEGAAMGSPVSPIVADLYMEYFKRIALRTATNPPNFG